MRHECSRMSSSPPAVSSFDDKWTTSESSPTRFLLLSISSAEVAADALVGILEVVCDVFEARGASAARPRRVVATFAGRMAVSVAWALTSARAYTEKPSQEPPHERLPPAAQL
jgi:hypothetical protein